MNPYIMHKDYTTGDDVMDYFVSFRTENKDLNIKRLFMDNYYQCFAIDNNNNLYSWGLNNYY